jgi:signal transduction histidine kinase
MKEHGVTEQTAPDTALARLRQEHLRQAAPAVQHEVNNALMVLTSNLDLLGRLAPEGKPRRQLDRAQEALQRLDETVRSFLDAARRPVEEPGPASVAEVVAQVAPLLRVVLGARHGFDLEAAEGLPPVTLDRARLDLALLVLAREAAGRMAQGARIKARVEPRPGEVALRLVLPEGARPDGEAARLILEAGRGGRVEAAEGGLALVWPVA